MSFEVEHDWRTLYSTIKLFIFLYILINGYIKIIKHNQFLFIEIHFYEYVFIFQIHRKRKRLTADRTPPRLSTRDDKTKRKQKKKEKKRPITTEEVARTYTGLDRVIAEEFIEICDRHCTSDTSASGTTSDSASHEGRRK